MWILLLLQSKNIMKSTTKKDHILTNFMPGSSFTPIIGPGGSGGGGGDNLKPYMDAVKMGMQMMQKNRR